MNDPVWLDRRALELLHSESIAEHGAPTWRCRIVRVRALTRPQNLFAYQNVTDVARLASSYAFGLTKNHAFVDGNKRIGFIAAGLFLT